MLIDVLQFAYRTKHSTEIAVLKVQSDLLSSLEECPLAFPFVLDLLAAFDHAFLLSRLRDMYRICDRLR